MNPVRVIGSVASPKNTMLHKNNDFVWIDLACLECSKHCVGSPGTQPRLQKRKEGCRIDDSEDQHSICSEIDQSYKYNSDHWHYFFGWSSVLCFHISMNLFTTEWIIIVALDLTWMIKYHQNVTSKLSENCKFTFRSIFFNFCPKIEHRNVCIKQCWFSRLDHKTSERSQQSSNPIRTILRPSRNLKQSQFRSKSIATITFWQCYRTRTGLIRWPKKIRFRWS